MLRVAVSERARLERVRLVGDDGAGKFGMDAADLVVAARQAVASPHLELLGLHAFGASNVLDAGALVEHVRDTVRTARRLAMAVGVALRLVDAGGGLGIPYEPHEASLDLERLGAGLAAIVDDWPTDPVLRDARLLLEPGRFLVGPSGAYLARVVDRKTVGRGRSSSSSTAASITCSGRRSSARSIGSARWAVAATARTVPARPGWSRSRSPGRSVPASTSSARRP